MIKKIVLFGKWNELITLVDDKFVQIDCIILEHNNGISFIKCYLLGRIEQYNSHFQSFCFLTYLVFAKNLLDLLNNMNNIMFIYFVFKIVVNEFGCKCFMK